MAGGEVVSVQMAHVWVEAFVPYSDYRGQGTSAQGPQWVPLDPALGGHLKYSVVPAALDALTVLGTDAPTLTAGYLALPPDFAGSQTPLEYVQAQVETWLTQNSPGTTFAQTLWSPPQQRPEHLGFLPAALPYPVIAVAGEYAFLPDDLTQQVNITGSNAAGPYLTVTLPVYRFLGHRSLLTFEPATTADWNVVAQYGGLYGAPASAVQLLMTLRIDDAVQSTATQSVGLGETDQWTLSLGLPSGASAPITNSIVAGNTVALGFGGPGNGYVAPATPDNTEDGAAGCFVYSVAAQYVNQWTADEDELAALLGVVPVRPAPNVVFVENQLSVSTQNGVPQSVTFEGVLTDADFRVDVPVEVVPNRASTLLALSGLDGSELEAQILAVNAGAAAVATTSLLQAANAQGAVVLQLTPANAGSQLQLLTAPTDVVTDVQNQLAQGRTVTIPAAPMTLQSWTGTGYRALDPMTGEGGYFMSGMVSGSYTIASPTTWKNQSLAQLLSSGPISGTAVNISATNQPWAIVAMPNTMQGQVGTTIPITACVLGTAKDSNGNPQRLRGATVTFAQVAPSLALVGAPDAGAAPTWSDSTKENGCLTASMVLSTNIMASFVAISPSDGGTLPQIDGGMSSPFGCGTPQQTDGGGSPDGGTYPQLVGLNVITASTQADAGSGTTTIRLPAPFVALASPQCAPVTLRPGPGPQLTLAGTSGAFVINPGLGSASALSVVVTDKYKNPLANQTVHWSASPASSVGLAPAGPTTAPVVFYPTPPATLPSTASTTSDTYGNASIQPVANWGIGPVTVTAGVDGASSLPLIINVGGGPTYAVIALDPNGIVPNTGGFAGTPFHDPINAEIVMYAFDGGSYWTPVTATNEVSLGLTSAGITMIETPADAGPISTTITLSDAGPGPVMSFRPMYIGDGGLNVTFYAVLKDSNRFQFCCSGVDDEAESMNTTSTPPHMDIYTQIGGVLTGPASPGNGGAPGSPAPLANGATVLSTAGGLRVVVPNPSAWPAYLAVTNGAGPGAGSAAVTPDLPYVGGANTSLLTPLATTYVDFTLNPSAPGQTVTFAICVPTPDAGPTPGLGGGAGPGPDCPQGMLELAPQTVSVQTDSQVAFVTATVMPDGSAQPSGNPGTILPLGDGNNPQSTWPQFFITIVPTPNDGSSIIVRIASQDVMDLTTEFDYLNATLTPANNYMAGPFYAVGAAAVGPPPDTTLNAEIGAAVAGTDQPPRSQLSPSVHSDGGIIVPPLGVLGMGKPLVPPPPSYLTGPIGWWDPTWTHQVGFPLKVTWLTTRGSSMSTPPDARNPHIINPADDERALADLVAPGQSLPFNTDVMCVPEDPSILASLGADSAFYSQIENEPYRYSIDINGSDLSNYVFEWAVQQGSVAILSGQNTGTVTVSVPTDTNSVSLRLVVWDYTYASTTSGQRVETLVNIPVYSYQAKPMFIRVGTWDGTWSNAVESWPQVSGDVKVSNAIWHQACRRLYYTDSGDSDWLMLLPPNLKNSGIPCNSPRPFEQFLDKNIWKADEAAHPKTYLVYYDRRVDQACVPNSEDTLNGHTIGVFYYTLNSDIYSEIYSGTTFLPGQGLRPLAYSAHTMAHELGHQWDLYHEDPQDELMYWENTIGGIDVSAVDVTTVRGY